MPVIVTNEDNGIRYIFCLQFTFCNQAFLLGSYPFKQLFDRLVRGVLWHKSPLYGLLKY